MGDLISREALLEEYEWLMSQTADCSKPLLQEHIDRINRQPAVQRKRKGCEFCGRNKPIKAFTVLPDCGLQYRPSIMAKFCPLCGSKIDEG